MDHLYSLIRFIVRPLIRVLWVKEVTGLNNIPKTGAAIVAMNHQSYFDFFCLAAIAPRNIHFLAAEKFFEHKIWSILMKVTRQIRVDRTSHEKLEMHRLVHSHIDEGRLIGIFPEGTRSPHEHDMLKAFSGVAKYSLYKKVPIIPVGIKGTYHVMSRHSSRIKFSRVVTLHVGPPMHFAEYHIKTEGISDEDYRKVTHLVMQEISKLSGKNYPHDQ